MKLVARERANRKKMGLMVAGALVAGAFLLSTHSEGPIAQQQERNGAVGTGSLGSVVEQNQANSDAAALAALNDGIRPETLPADASILPVQKIRWGNGDLEVMAGELLVRFEQGLSTEGQNSLLAAMGSKVMQRDEAMGYARVAVPGDEDMESFRLRLSQAEGIVSARPNVIMRGTANKCNLTGQYYGYQWHLSRSNHSNTCNTRPNDPTPVKVAVLDTGVAYENYNSYVQASDLATVPVTAPFDAVNEDYHANDDHQHGTHIATTLLGAGRISGVTPGATLMPVKVLDASNKGNEYDLAQGIRWAVDHGAKLINMSLSFPSSYLPSGLLQDAVTYASTRGVLLVASSGNNGDTVLPYPAAFREVLSVGATRMKRLANGTIVDEIASYSNTGPGLDVVVPGGNLSTDANLDGWPDGILAQTIRPGNPSQTSYYFYTGTSQAAGIVSGIATWLMAAGATAEQAKDAILSSATDLGPAGYDTTYGQGQVSLDAAVSAYVAQLSTSTPSIFANIVPVIYKSNGNEWGVARVRLVRQNGSPVANALVFGRWSGSAGGDAVGMTNSQGYVNLASPTVPDDADGAIFSIEVNTVVDPASGRRVKPMEYYYLSQGFSALMNGALDNEETEQTLIAFDVDPLDASLASQFDVTKLSRCFSIKAIGPSLGTPGVGIVFSPDFIPGLAENSVPKQEISIAFGGNLPTGSGSSSSGLVTVYNGGVGLAMMSLNKSGGVGLAMLALNKSGGVGMAMLALNRLGGVGLAMMGMSVMPLDVAMLTGMSADGTPAELIRNDYPDQFEGSNLSLNSDLLVSLGDTRFAANSIDVASMDAVITANSMEDAESDNEFELGIGTVDGLIEFAGEPPAGLITVEE